MKIRIRDLQLFDLDQVEHYKMPRTHIAQALLNVDCVKEIAETEWYKGHKDDTEMDYDWAVSYLEKQLENEKFWNRKVGD